MSVENLFKKETVVKISVVKIDNKKLTKGVFNQINQKSPFDKLYDLRENVNFLGYVNDNGKWVVWTNDESLYKYKIIDFYSFLRIDFSRNTIDELYKIYPSEVVKSLYSHTNELGHYENQGCQISQVLELNEQISITDKKENIEQIIDELVKRQIFL